jgi:hypothetical protein
MKRLKTVKDYQKDKKERWERAQVWMLCGLECPNCKKEIEKHLTNIGVVYEVYPQLHNFRCIGCGWIGTF